jgi:starch synthase (maltosyl-transferring)
MTPPTPERRRPAAGASPQRGLPGAGGLPQDGRQRVVIESVEPAVDGGAYPAKRVLGDRVIVSADLIADGHDILGGELLVRGPEAPPSEAELQGVEARAASSEAASSPGATRSIPLEALGNDRYQASFDVDAIGLWHYSIRAWVDHYASYRRGLSRKVEAGQDVEVELLIGAELVSAAAARASGEARNALRESSALLSDRSRPAHERAERATSNELARLMAAHPDRSHSSSFGRWLPLWVDRERARYSAWYEMFPRSTGPDGKHGSFKTAAAKLPYVAAMGFDVLYLPPIHPIGRTFRKGKNNQPSAESDDVGSPWAIGSEAGGHESIHPELGTLADFDEFQKQAARHGLELALDIALQVTPDHPYVKEHPEWFRRRPDGSIQYAENPPKKYQDIYPFDFECEAWQSLWLELKRIFEVWMERGVRIFRVDNPHTKSIPFWHWCIAELRAQHPDVLFLAEAFTRPKLMYLLAKAGFTQSYTYFTWRNTGPELMQYMRELTSPPVSDYFRPNFWPNTPDILPEHLQHAGRAAFALRLVLASTLSSSYGVYGPAYELMDNVPRGGVEEYVDNEKYQLRAWDLNREDTLLPLIARINRIRKENPALQYNQIEFLKSENPLLFCFIKHSPDGENNVLVVANMDVHHAQGGWVDLELPQPERAGVIASEQPVQLHDLLSDARYFSQGRRLFVQLDPGSAPAHIFRLRRRARTEHDFDYFV